MIQATLYSDPACPWAYSECPALRVLEWRYADQLNWRLVVVGLSEDTSRYERNGYTPGRSALGQVRFRDDYGKPVSTLPQPGPSPSSPACRAIVAARLQAPGGEWRVFRALQLANFTTPFLFKDTDAMREVLRGVRGIDADAVVDAISSPEVIAAYERDKAET